MKNNKTFAVATAMVVVVLGGVTVFGANELRNTQLFSNRNTEYTNVYEDENLYSSIESAKINGDIQEITTELDANNFPVIVVQKDVPLKWTIVADERNLNYCNNQIIIPSQNLEENISVDENVIEFTPTESGIMPYSCSMGMLNSSIVVVDDIDNYDKSEIETQLAQIPKVNCCGR